MSPGQRDLEGMDQAAGLRDEAGRRLGGVEYTVNGQHYCRVIAVTGGKGGVGKTNVAVNLSLALQEAGARVLLLDADLGLANVDLLLGLDPQHTLQHVVHREAQLEDILLEGPLGLHILPGGTGLPELANLNTLDIVRLLGSLRSLERQHDLLVIDTAAGISQQVTRFAQAADDVVIVCTPEPPSMLDAYGLIKALRGHQHVGQLHLLVNMVSRRGETEQTHKSLATVTQHYLGLDLQLLGELPRDDGIVECVKRQQPFFIARPRSAPSRLLRLMALAFLDGLDLKPQRGEHSFFSRLLNSFR
jgi:flagellar biosynthesis protein FlhG